MRALRRILLVGLLLIAPVQSTFAHSQPLGKIDRELVASVFLEICRLNIKHPEVVMRQAILESGWMRAPFLMKRNNLFGFRSTTYLVFKDWKDSVAYYKSWQDKHYRAAEHKDYVAFLISIRYASAGYTEHLRKIRWESSCPDQAPGRSNSSLSPGLQQHRLQTPSIEPHLRRPITDHHSAPLLRLFGISGFGLVYLGMG